MHKPKDTEAIAEHQEFMKRYLAILNLVHDASSSIIQGVKTLDELFKEYGDDLYKWANDIHWDADVKDYRNAYEQLLHQCLAIEQLGHVKLQQKKIPLRGA